MSKFGEQKLDITEDIEIVFISVESVLDKIIQGEISVAGTVAALFLGLNFLTFNYLKVNYYVFFTVTSDIFLKVRPMS